MRSTAVLGVTTSVVYAALAVAFCWVLDPGVFAFWFTIPTAMVVSIVLVKIAEQNDSLDDPQTYFLIGLCGLALIAVLTLFFNMLPGQGAKLHSQIYKEGVEAQPYLAKSEESVFASIDIAKAPLVSEKMAALAATQLLSERPAMASQVEVGRFQKQKVGEELFWVAPLEPRGFFKWASLDGTPGYVKVSATNAQDAQLVTSLNGQNLSFKVTEYGWFSGNLDRVLWVKFPTKQFTNHSLELDQEGNPFFVSTHFKSVIGFTTVEPVGVAITDPQSGEVSYHTMKEIPEWVDQVIPQYAVEEQVSQWGNLVHGRLNWAAKDVLQVSSIDLIFDKENNPVYAVGLKAANTDAGIQGYVFVDTRTKKATHFVTNGISEGRAIQAAEGLNPEKEFEATNPTPFIVNGKPAYVFGMTRNDQNRAFAIVSMDNYEAVAVSETLQSTYNQYSTLSSKYGLTADSQLQSKEIEGVVLAIGQDSKSGLFKVLIKKSDSTEKATVYSADSAISDYLVLTEKGHKVKLSSQEGQQNAVILSFENLTLLNN